MNTFREIKDGLVTFRMVVTCQRNGALINKSDPPAYVDAPHDAHRFWGLKDSDLSKFSIVGIQADGSQLTLPCAASKIVHEHKTSRTEEKARGPETKETVIPEDRHCFAATSTKHLAPGEYISFALVEEGAELVKHNLFPSLPIEAGQKLHVEFHVREHVAPVRGMQPATLGQGASGASVKLVATEP